MASKLDICNLALNYLGFSALTTLDDSTRQGTSCLAMWGIIVDEVMASEPWNFATARETLQQLSVAPLYGYAYAYQLPSDLIRLLSTQDSTSRYHKSGYAREGSTLLSNLSLVSIKYIRRITEPGLFPPGFTACLAARLAAALSYGLTDNTQKRSTELLQTYAVLRKEAALVDASEGYEPIRERDSWLRGRGDHHGEHDSCHYIP